MLDGKKWIAFFKNIVFLRKDFKLKLNQDYLVLNDCRDQLIKAPKHLR